MRKEPSYWTGEIQSLAVSAKNFTELSQIGIEVLKTLPEETIVVCGPVSTGGLGSIEENLKRLNDTVHQFIENGESVFDQTPFEDVIKRLREEQKDADGTKTLEEFYLPIFESGYVSEMRFLHGWESSVGAKWEHELAKKFGIKITYL